MARTRTIVSFDDLGPTQPSAATPAAQAQRKRNAVSFDDLAPRVRSEEGKIQGALVNGLESIRLKREERNIEQRNFARSTDPLSINPETGVSFAQQEAFDREAFRPFARSQADESVAAATGKIDFRELDPLGIMAGVADEKLAARFNFVVNKDSADLKAFEYSDEGRLLDLVAQYDVTQTADVVKKIRDSYPQYGADLDPNGLQPSKIIEAFRRDKYPDLTYDEMMAGFGHKSRDEQGLSALVADAKPKMAPFSDAWLGSFYAKAARYTGAIAGTYADVTGNTELAKESKAVRNRAAQEEQDLKTGRGVQTIGENAGVFETLRGYAEEVALMTADPVDLATAAATGGVGALYKAGKYGAAAAKGYRAAKAAGAVNAVRSAAAAMEAGAAAQQLERMSKVAAYGVIAGAAAPESYLQAREKGKGQLESALYAATQTGIEFASESPLVEFLSADRRGGTFREALSNYGSLVANSVISEAAAGAVQEPIEREWIGRDDPFSWDEYGRSVLLQGLSGGASAGLAGAPRLTADAVNSWRQVEPIVAAEALARRLGGTPPAATPQPAPAAPAAPAPAAAATPAPAAPAPQQAAPAPAPAPTQPAPGETEQQTAQRALRESKAREDFTERLAEFEQSQGRAASQPERERIATEVATDYEVLRATIYKPSQDTATATPTQGAADVRAQQQPATRGRRRGGAARPVDAGGVPAGGVPADADVPGGGANVTGASAGVAGRRADELGTAAPAPAAPDPAVRADDADAALTPPPGVEPAPVAQTQTETPAQVTAQAAPQPAQSGTPGARTVRISNRDFEVAPENVPLVEEADRAYEDGMRAAAAQFERESRAPREPGADPDIGAKTAKERFQAQRKALGMRRAAAYRQAAGIEAMTPKERAAKAKRDAVARPGDQVTLEDGSAAEVVKDAGFGRLTVRRPDGQTVTVPRASVAKAAPASAPPAAPAPEPFDLAAAVAGQVQQRPIQFSQQVSGATGGDQPQRRAQSATPAPTPAQAEGGRREAPEAVRQPEGQGQGQGRSEGLPDAVEPDAITFADPGQAMTRVPVEVPGRDGKPTVVNVPIGSYLSALSKRVAACQTLLNCMRRG